MLFFLICSHFLNDLFMFFFTAILYYLRFSRYMTINLQCMSIFYMYADCRYLPKGTYVV